MKNKFTAITVLAISLFSASAAMSQEKKSDNFDKRKAVIISHLNQQKVIIDQEINCINSAQNRDSAKSCKDNKIASMKKLRSEAEAHRDKMKSERKANREKRKEEKS
ncbi:MAG: hypothetical protein ACJAZX_000015 [Rickettsiales bacterium]|jgi:hypothetical protein